MLSKTARFWDKIAPRYAARPVDDLAGYQAKLAISEGYLSPETSLLELGCGTGSTALHHAPKVKHLVATDFSPSMLAIAKQKAAQQNCSNITFECADASTFQPDCRFDVIMAHSLLHLVEGKETLIARIYDWLPPGGVFISNTPCIADIMPIFRWIGPLGEWLGLLPKLRVFSASELKSALQAAGFVIESEFQPTSRKALYLVCRKPYAV
ncbi:methyltransferase domain-containing protein [Aestuariibacter halophilus]|uniref:Methyltransferase domain-containing protein n=1 Tax=Fluctibacter halophilus TaxID=226011 RepID=A0ABS8G8N0_9ALTE|nr:class I SAM-dependent methyltransferase [Aestuariibacter halophilus]MCC2616044.1 methyltransferase domain-containing protein [Aestuariibacter halophilus]